MDSVVDQNVWIIDFLKSNTKSVSECDLFQSEQNNDVEEDAAYFLNNITINSKLFFKLNIKNENFHEKIPKNLEELNIQNSQWIGYDKLLKIDCKSVTLNKNRISDDQLNLFIKKWIAMETHLNLELLELDYRELDNFRDCVLHDIPYEEIDGGVKRVLKTCRDKNIEINGGIDIRRIDGKTATFFAKRTFWKQYLAMSIH
ncbi:hypothetical protein CRE_23041 [Caenorhabditis remanei]|uniref:Sdz-33 F-box domain-containing protein n=1 Tax=Caenorhabditis remanei TaxID=31234 RepID=E3N4H7_CAERE|nr:hypothetical protein CRE_23041 [Caenorhabditis remanei]